MSDVWEDDDACIWPRCGAAGECNHCDDPVVAMKTYTDGDHIVMHGIRHSEFYLPGPVNVTTSSDAERTKVSSQASGNERVEPKQKINPPSNGDEQP